MKAITTTVGHLWSQAFELMSRTPTKTETWTLILDESSSEIQEIKINWVTAWPARTAPTRTPETASSGV